MPTRPGYVDTQNFGLDDLFFADRLVMTKPFPPHRHSFAELHYIKSGAGTETVNGVTYPLGAGSLSLKMPWHVHELRPDPASPLEILKCSFRMSALESGGLLQSVGDLLAQNYDFCPVTCLPGADRPAAEEVLAQLCAEWQSLAPLKEEMMAALTARLLLTFVRRMQLLAPDAPACTANDILRLMNLRYRDPALTCADIARAVHYSESQTARLLEQQFGLTFGELLREIRIRSACELLKTTAHPVESIAQWVGYASRDGFYAAFASDRGLTPAEFRKRYALRPGEGPQALSSGQIHAKVVYYLHRHYAEPVTAEDAAERFGYSAAALNRLLARQGVTFARLLAEIRVYHARQLLLQGGLTAEAVGRAVGFSSPETFYRAFRRCTGVSPGEYCRGAAALSAGRTGPDAVLPDSI